MEYLTTLAIALLLNKDNGRMLLLTCVVGLSYFLPVEKITDRDTWFVSCIMVEILVITLSLYLKTKASLPVAGVCCLLIFKHLLGWNRMSLNDYALLVQYFEYLEIMCCLLFSNKVLEYIGGGLRCQTQKY